MNDEIKIGGSGLPQDAHAELSDLIASLSERYEFKHGATAAFWAMAFSLNQHLGEGLE